MIIFFLLLAWSGVFWSNAADVQSAFASLTSSPIEAQNRSRAKIAGLKFKQLSYEMEGLSTHSHVAIYASGDDQKPVADILVDLSNDLRQGGAVQRSREASNRFTAVWSAALSPGALSDLSQVQFKRLPLLGGTLSCDDSPLCDFTANLSPYEINGDQAIRHNFSVEGLRIKGQFPRVITPGNAFVGRLDLQVLPLRFDDVNLGSGSLSAQSTEKTASLLLSWKTDQGQSKVSFAVAVKEPFSQLAQISDYKTGFAKLAKNIASMSLDFQISRAELIDLWAKITTLDEGEAKALRPEFTQQIDAQIQAIPHFDQLVSIKGDTYSSHWKWADGKLTVNGGEQPEMQAKLNAMIKTISAGKGGDLLPWSD